MKDPIDYMNQVCGWKQPPPWSDQWANAVGHACEIIVKRDARIAELESQLAEAKWWTTPPNVNGWFFMAERAEDYDLARPTGVSRHEYGDGTVEYKISWSENATWWDRNANEFPDAVWWGPIQPPVGRPPATTPATQAQE